MGVAVIALVGVLVAGGDAPSAPRDPTTQRPDVPSRSPIAADAPAELATRWVEGDQLTYRIVLAHDLDYEFDTGEAYGGMYLNDAGFTLRVLDARSDGSADVEVTVPPVALEPGVNDLPVGVGRPQTVRFGRGHPQDRLIALFAGSDGQATDIGPLWGSLPAREVRPGETWPLRFELANPWGRGGLSYRGSCSFDGYENVGGGATARILCRANVRSDGVYEADRLAESGGLTVDRSARDGAYATSGTGRIWMWTWVDPARDVVVRADSRFEMDVEVLSSGFRPSWFRRGTTVGTIEQRIELVGGGPSGAA